MSSLPDSEWPEGLPFLPGLTLPNRVGRQRATTYATTTYDVPLVSRLRNDPAFGRRGRAPGGPVWPRALDRPSIWRSGPLMTAEAKRLGVALARFSTVFDHVHCLVDALERPEARAALARLDAGENAVALLVHYSPPRSIVHVFGPDGSSRSEFLTGMTIVLAPDPVRDDVPVLWESAPLPGPVDLRQLPKGALLVPGGRRPVVAPEIQEGGPLTGSDAV